ncbi:single-stranded DNA-binding protein [Leptolyngbya sp. PCC 7375]|nr:single-stranded DNA-binding protein [Leptolyngbya sp. PCC 7375]
MNNVSITGWLTKPPELNRYDSGSLKAKFSLKVYRNYQKSGEQKQVSFILCEAWGKIAENLCNHKADGKGELGITGELIQDRWEKDGQKHSKVYINATRIDYLRDGDNKPQGDNPQARPPAPEPVENHPHGVPDYDEIPF